MSDEKSYSPVFSEDSPFRKLPRNLNRPQLMFFDGIRFSVEMISLSYARLAATLLKISEEAVTEDSSDLPMLDRISALQEAWSIVDSTFRLKCLLEATPHLKKNMPDLQLFFRKTSAVTKLRNIIQHLNTEMKSLIQGNHPAWGVLCWTNITDAENFISDSFTYVPGTMFDSKDIPTLNPLGRIFREKIDHVELHAGKYNISISNLAYATLELAKKLEEVLSKQISGDNASGGDFLFAMTIQGNKSSESDQA